MKTFRSMDLFNKVNQDIDTSSATGGFFSIFALIAGLILFWSEYADFRTDELIYNMKVQQQTSSTIKAHIDILIKGSPCHLLALDLQDEVGNHTLDFTDTITKTRINAEGGLIQGELGENDPNYRGSQKELDETINVIFQKEQCQIKGYLLLNNVPGNFHVSYHAKMDVMNRIQKTNDEAYNQLNLNFQINHIGFGDSQTISPNFFSMMGRSLGLEHQESSPYDNQNFEGNGKNDFDNYLKVLPAHYANTRKAFSSDSYKFAMYSSSTPKGYGEIPAIFFRYEISPINVFYKTKSKSTYHFIVQVMRLIKIDEIFAIIGGIFSVMGIFNSLTTGVISSLKRNN